MLLFLAECRDGSKKCVASLRVVKGQFCAIILRKRESVWYSGEVLLNGDTGGIIV